MEDNKLDKEIKESLLKQTDQTLKNKEDIWRNIESKLDISKEKGENHTMKIEQQPIKKPKRNMRGWITGTVAAALLLGIFSTTTNTGQAFVNTIIEYFAPEKKVVQEIEGMPEEKEVVLEEKAGYIIYIDEERYKLVQENNIDKIVPATPLGEKYPEVSMSISQVEDQAPEALIQEIQANLVQNYETVKEIETVSEPVKGFVVSAIDGNEWNSPVTKVYVVSNDKGGSFVIDEKYFLEAEEGHGARFHYMLKEFKVVEKIEE